MKVADLGCGSGFYVLPAAQLVGKDGLVYAVDFDDAKLEATGSVARQMGYSNVRLVKADLTEPLTAIPEGSCDLCIVGNILHEVANKDKLLQNAYRLLGTNSGLLVVEWKKGLTPLGPPMSMRLDQTEVEIILTQKGFQKVNEIPADNYHYAMLFRK